MEPNSREFYKQCAFQKFCNTVLHNEACDAHRELHRHKPAGFIKDGLHGKLVMLKQQILFGGSVVGVFRVDMLECCQLRHLLS